jgi:hypothetical protein
LYLIALVAVLCILVCHRRPFEVHSHKLAQQVFFTKNKQETHTSQRSYQSYHIHDLMLVMQVHSHEAGSWSECRVTGTQREALPRVLSLSFAQKLKISQCEAKRFSLGGKSVRTLYWQPPPPPPFFCKSSYIHCQPYERKLEKLRNPFKNPVASTSSNDKLEIIVLFAEMQWGLLSWFAPQNVAAKTIGAQWVGWLTPRVYIPVAPMNVDLTCTMTQMGTL